MSTNFQISQSFSIFKKVPSRFNKKIQTDQSHNQSCLNQNLDLPFIFKDYQHFPMIAQKFISKKAQTSYKRILKLKNFNQNQWILETAAQKTNQFQTQEPDFNYLPETPLNTTQFIREQMEKEETNNNESFNVNTVGNGSMIGLIDSDIFNNNTLLNANK